ncbi:hypothetical protein Agabi119p4_1362 [Agaricus bisporus var. burnettii]|uniref:Uncharacterized protein n=1 Tax=Agaricus bisporus var. burnettii TaxID=192524 RepID=A0A8H7FCB6_AGABI|nr:hypothetical protein Agabi119p4_1362 [Agaricus bisporus var. burnettii]
MEADNTTTTTTSTTPESRTVDQHLLPLHYLSTNERRCFCSWITFPLQLFLLDTLQFRRCCHLPTHLFSPLGHLPVDPTTNLIKDFDKIKPTAHIFYKTRMLDVPDGLPKWDGYENQSNRLDLP